MLKSKIHRATVTAARIDYEGSVSIDRELMAAADIIEHEQVHVLDVDNGERLVTYAIPGTAGEIAINGAAARRVEAGHTVIIVSYGDFAPSEWAAHEPRIVLVGKDNTISDVRGPAVTAEAAGPTAAAESQASGSRCACGKGD